VPGHQSGATGQSRKNQVYQPWGHDDYQGRHRQLNETHTEETGSVPSVYNRACFDQCNGGVSMLGCGCDFNQLIALKCEMHVLYLSLVHMDPNTIAVVLIGRG